MSNLYVYDFGDEQYIVDDSGNRYQPVVFNQPDIKTIVCESCFYRVTEALEDEHGHVSCWSCYDVTAIDLTKTANEILLDKGMGFGQVIPSLFHVGMKVTERGEDGMVVLYHPGLAPFNAESYTRWREITLGGTIYGYSYAGEIEQGTGEPDGLEEEAWADSHSVTCHCCGGNTDERNIYMLTDDYVGQVCPECHHEMQKEIDGANAELLSFILSDEPSEADVIRELACRLVNLKRSRGIGADKPGGDDTILFKDDPRTQIRTGG